MPQRPLPHTVTLPNGKKRTLYRDLNGKLISKAAYEELKASLKETKPIEPNRFELIAADQLRMTARLPSQLPVYEFFGSNLERLKAVDSFYSMLALIHAGKVDVVKDFMSSLREDDDNTGVPNPVLHEYLSAAAVEPLRLDRFHYGSDAVTDVLGIAKVLETLVSLVEKWVNRKYDKELRQRDLELKDEEILDRRAERHAKETQNFLNLLSALKSPGLQLSREDLMLLLRTSESTAAPILDLLLQHEVLPGNATNDANALMLRFIASDQENSFEHKDADQKRVQGRESSS